MTIQEYPAEIERVALEFHEVSSEYSDVKENLRGIKSQIEQSVYEAKGSDDKPPHKNDRERAQAVCEALNDSAAYQRNLELEQQLDARKAMLAAYVERPAPLRLHITNVGLGWIMQICFGKVESKVEK